MATKQQILTAIYTPLSSDTTLQSLGVEIFELEAPENTQFPYCVIHDRIDKFDSTFTDDQVIDGRILIITYANRKLGAGVARQISDRVLTLLNRVDLTVTGWSQCRSIVYNPGVPIIENNAIRIDQVFRIFAS